MRRLATFLIGLTIPLAAHHPFNTEYDASKPVTLTGSIQNVDWMDPHVTFTLKVMDPANPGEWKLEAAKPSFLQDHEITEATFRTGAMVTVQAFRSRSDTLKASARAIKLPSGQTYAVADSMEDGGPQPVVSDAAQPPVKGSPH